MCSGGKNELCDRSSFVEVIVPEVQITHLSSRMLCILFLSPLPPGGPGEGPDCHFPREIDDFEPISARIRGCFIFEVASCPARSTLHRLPEFCSFCFVSVSMAQKTHNHKGIFSGRGVRRFTGGFRPQGHLPRPISDRVWPISSSIRDPRNIPI